jgi:indolepyruvate ferredoxin oxidoreductase
MSTVKTDDPLVATEGRVFMSGIQALVRLLVVQRLRDEKAGLKTGGFVSGYRGSPLGGLDEALWKAKAVLEEQHIQFVPGVNEELAATAVWGSQQVSLVGPTDYDGVFGLWYGKGPGVDRCGDVFKHMNFSGTSRHGGVLLVAGDDHGAYSSTLPHQTDHLFAASMIPVLYPCNVQEYLELGLHGFAMSRFSGCAVAFKALADTVESSASIPADPFALQTVIPADVVLPEGGLSARLWAGTLGSQARAQEALMQDHKIYAAIAYARANRLNRVTVDSPNARLGIVASGKSYMDVLEALEELGIDEAAAARIGIRLFKVGMPWPLEPVGVREFARGLEEILVVEEKRQVVEYQLKEHLYNWNADVRPRVIGKFDEQGEWVGTRGEWLLPATSDFSVAQIARVIASRIARFHQSDLISARLSFLEAKEAVLRKAVDTPARPAYYCSGCPHNRSTKVPEGSVALAGIGCHVMASSIYPEHTKTMTQMGGEGVTWIGQAMFSNREHVFANLGDGTYFHSGHLALRAAVAANVNITYKILYNDAVAMTGGQPIDGTLTVPQLAHQVAAEGVRRIALVTEDLGRYTDRAALPAIVTLHDRKTLDGIQREMREVKGVSVILYDQTCAAEKRRRRKKGEFPQAKERVFINSRVCEGCGDCGVASNCVSLLPLETEFGRKREIDQSACNQDTTCVEGFCPSFVTLTGAKVRKSRSQKEDTFPALPEPAVPALTDRPYNIIVTGIGGTGVITIGAMLGLAAHLEGKGVSVLDMTGMSQKNGAVTSHVRLALNPSSIHAQRVATGEADLVLGCDMLTAGSQDVIAKTRPGVTVAVVNLHEQPPGYFARQPDWQFPTEKIRALIDESVADRSHYVDATRLATALMGDAIATNLFMLGYAYQKGLVPLGADAIARAIEHHGVAVKSNLAAFLWGRRAAADLAKVEQIATPTAPVVVQMPVRLDDLVRRHVKFLTEYQNAAYAARYSAVVEKVKAAESALGRGDSLAKAVARSLFKLMAYKDEYEVARLYADGEFRKQLEATFEGDFEVTFHLAPPLFAKRDAQGRLTKRRYGPWMARAFGALARLKFLRGTGLDPFGRTEERQLERKLIEDYVATVEALLPRLDEGNRDLALELAAVPEQMRGFGHVKEANVKKALARWKELEAALSAVTGNTPKAAPAQADRKVAATVS